MPSKFHEPLPPEPDNEVEVFVEPDEPPPAPPRRRAEDWEPRTKHHDVTVSMPADAASFGMSPLVSMIFKGGAAALVLVLYWIDQRDKSAQIRETQAQQRENAALMMTIAREDKAELRAELEKQRLHDSAERELTRNEMRTTVGVINSMIPLFQSNIAELRMSREALDSGVKALKTALPKKPTSMLPDDLLDSFPSVLEPAPMPRAAT